MNIKSNSCKYHRKWIMILRNSWVTNINNENEAIKGTQQEDAYLVGTAD